MANIDTILTSFPQRWGRHERTTSTSVYRRIREILDSMADTGERLPIHKLALTIIEECSAMLVDRSRAISEQPELLSIFKSAISEVVCVPRTRLFTTY